MDWRVRISQHAVADLDTLLRWTGNSFGRAQSDRYGRLIEATILRLAQAPRPPGSRQVDASLPHVFQLHLPGRARHRLVYRVEDGDILVLRILHDVMDPTRHLP